MPRVAHLKCVSVVPLNDRKVVSFDAIQLPVESDATSLTSQTGYRLVFDETYEEPCLSDPDDGLYHPVQAVPHFHLNNTTTQSTSNGVTGIDMTSSEIVRQHNTLLTQDFVSPGTPAMYGVANIGLTIGIINITFAAPGAVNNIRVYSSGTTGYTPLYAGTIGTLSTGVTYKISVPFTISHGTDTDGMKWFWVAASTNINITEADIRMVTIGTGSWGADMERDATFTLI